MPEELYETPRQEPSQGDIIEFLPHIFLDGSLVALHKENETSFTATNEPFAAFDDKNGQSIVAICKRQKAIVLSHDCEIDKVHVKRWLVSPVIPLVTLSERAREIVRRNRTFAMFHLPKYRDVLTESFVDFNQISTINGDLVKAASRLVSLSDVGRRGLYMQFIRWFTRWELRGVTCPACSVSFEPSQVMPVRSA